MTVITPYNNKENKKKQVQIMFDSIAEKYDFLNHFLSFGIDRFWRKKLIKKIKKYKHDRILDIATGTADLAISAVKLNPLQIIGIDISENMLKIGEKKVKKLGLDQLIELKQADAENIPFSDKSFDVVMVAFGIRNFENLNAGLQEIFRVLNQGGMFIVLEFSKPTAFPIKQLYGLYSKWILPHAGKRISGDKNAYTYLPKSVKAFPEGKELLNMFKQQGFTSLCHKSLSFRIVTLYYGFKL